MQPSKSKFSGNRFPVEIDFHWKKIPKSSINNCSPEVMHSYKNILLVYVNRLTWLCYHRLLSLMEIYFQMSFDFEGHITVKMMVSRCKIKYIILLKDAMAGILFNFTRYMYARQHILPPCSHPYLHSCICF